MSRYIYYSLEKGKSRFFYGAASSIDFHVEMRKGLKIAGTEGMTVQTPPLHKMLRSRTVPRLIFTLPALDDIDVRFFCQVPDKYVTLQYARLRLAFYEGFSHKDGDPKQDQKDLGQLRQHVRSRLIDLLSETSTKSSQWIDHPDHPGLIFLNSQLEKIDLGRRKDLKFSSEQSEESIAKTDRNKNLRNGGIVPVKDRANTFDPLITEESAMSFGDFKKRVAEGKIKL